MPENHMIDGNDMSSAMVNSFFCFGLGYSASRLIRILASEDETWRLAGSTRTGRKYENLPQDLPEDLLKPDDLLKPGDLLKPDDFLKKVEVVAFDGQVAMAGGVLAQDGSLAQASHILLSVPPDDHGDPVLACHGPDLAALGDPAGRGNLRWLGYLSTTGVYGDAGGGWVDEETPLAPVSAAGERRLRAEAGWQRLAEAHGLPLHIFRLPGIYGPGRSAIERLRAGNARRIIKAGQIFSRIHVDDLAAALRASMARPGDQMINIYNIADDLPAPPQDVVAHGARLLGLPVPPDIPFEEANLSALGRGFYAESKRVGNARMKAELGVELIYPDYRAGLASILAGTC